MSKRTLDSIFASARSAPPSVPEQDARALIEGIGAPPERSTKTFSHNYRNIIIAGAVMLTMLSIILGLLFLWTPDRTIVQTPEGPDQRADKASPAIDNAPGDAAHPDALKMSEHDRSSAAEKSGGPVVRSEILTHGTASDHGRTSNGSAAALPPENPLMTDCPARSIEFRTHGDPGKGAQARSLSFIDETSPLILEQNYPLYTGDIDSSARRRDTLLDYSGFYLSASYSTRSFNALNASLATAGFPAISKGGGFSGALTFEFPRPGGAGGTQPAFPGYLYPAKRHYSPAVSVEWTSRPEIQSSDGTTKAALSSWTLALDNNFYLKEFEQSRLLLVLSYCFNWTSFTVSRNRSFDELLNTPDAGAATMTRSYPFLIRTALRYDYVLGGNYMYLGLSAGYTFTLSKGGWSLRSGLDFNPGISTPGGPDDNMNGWYFGFHFTMR